jgi:lysophospholipase L1-like esterase
VAQGQSALLVTRKDPHHRPGKRRPDAAKTGEVALSRGRRASFLVAIALLIVVCAEGLFAIALRLTEGQWPYTRPKSANYLLFEPNPQWVITPRKNISVTVLGNSHHHNSDGFRGNEFSRVKTKPRIACIGGSTTYCIGVADNQTWPFYLDQLLQPDYEVLNFGIPGHSSAEHKKLLPYVLDRYSPDIVIFQMGLNDLRSMNLDDPGPDYANFHQPSLRFTVTGACRRDRLPRCALIQGTVVLLEKLKVLSVSPFPHGPPAGHVSDSVDPRVVETFSANLDILVRECLAKHIRVVLLPHAMSPETISDTNYKWWAPYLTKKGIFNALDALNAVMRRRADGDRVIYAGFMDGVTWDPAEFVDPSHLNSNGNLRLARLLKEGVPWSRFLGEEGLAPK